MPHSNKIKLALINEDIVEYDFSLAISKTPYEGYNKKNDSNYEYLGDGIIHSITGIEDKFLYKEICSFWKIRAKND